MPLVPSQVPRRRTEKTHPPMPKSKVRATFTCTGCSTVYKRKEAAFEWIGGEQVFTDTCWRCYNKDTDKPVLVRPKLQHDSMCSSWNQRFSHHGQHFKPRT